MPKSSTVWLEHPAWSVIHEDIRKGSKNLFWIGFTRDFQAAIKTGKFQEPAEPPAAQSPVLFSLNELSEPPEAQSPLLFGLNAPRHQKPGPKSCTVWSKRASWASRGPKSSTVWLKTHLGGQKVTSRAGKPPNSESYPHKIHGFWKLSVKNSSWNCNSLRQNIKNKL